MVALTLDAQQSAENTRLAGTLVDAMMGSDDAVTNRAAIGLMAGWDVTGLIRNGNFFLGSVGTSDVTAWLDFALERPIGRSALLDPSVHVVAVGPAMPQGGGALGAAVTTYAMFESDDHSAEATRFFERIAQRVRPEGSLRRRACRGSARWTPSLHAWRGRARRRWTHSRPRCRLRSRARDRAYTATRWRRTTSTRWRCPGC